MHSKHQTFIVDFISEKNYWSKIFKEKLVLYHIIKKIIQYIN